MRIVMFTNTYKPIVGGLEKSVEHCAAQFRKFGHEVKIVTPEFEDMEEEDDVIRIPAIQHFNGTDFSVHLPIHPHLSKELEAFQPQVIHSHHPFLIGDTALRTASTFDIPVVFTHHTLYEQYVHYVPFDKKTAKAFVKELSTGYGNLCSQVIAPSGSVKRIIKRRGLKTPVEVIPTGIHVDRLAKGDGAAFRKQWKIPADAFVAGYISRVAKEKNMVFLIKSLAAFLKKNTKAYALIVGSGAALEDVKAFFVAKQLSDRVVCTGVLGGNDLVNAYHSMDVFAFASHSETQGLVLAEAMAAGKPVVAVNAPGVRDILIDGENGLMLPKDNVKAFADALSKIMSLSAKNLDVMQKNARATAEDYNIEKTAEKLLQMYAEVIGREYIMYDKADSLWDKTREKLESEFGILRNMGEAAGKALKSVLQI